MCPWAGSSMVRAGRRPVPDVPLGLFFDLHLEAGLGSPLPVRFAGSDPLFGRTCGDQEEVEDKVSLCKFRS